MARVRRRTAALCALIFLAGFFHQALMASPWHPMIMTLAAETLPAHAVSPSMATGVTGATMFRSADGGSTPSPALRDCPAGQMVPPLVVAPPSPASFASAPPAAPPVASVNRPPQAGRERLSPAQRRALLQIYII